MIGDAEVETAIIALGREPGGGLVVVPGAFNASHSARCERTLTDHHFLGAVTSRPSLESWLRAISRIKPVARKMRRRLIALAGAADKRISTWIFNIIIE
jgi:hypothetical protein